MANSDESAGPLMACQECDLLQRIPPLPIRGEAHCVRCGYSLAARPSDPLQIPLALTVSAAIVFVVANAAPLLGLSAVGRHASTTISRALARVSADIAQAIRARRDPAAASALFTRHSRALIES